MRFNNNTFVFADGASMFFGKGRFDDFCAFYKPNPKARKRALRDSEYFSTAKLLAEKTSPEKFYNDFCKVYDATDKTMNSDIVPLISTISKDYDDLSITAEQTFCILYMGMLAEENRKNTKLGKRIKRLGVHNVILENAPVYSAANFMRGMSARDINDMCAERGF